MMNQMSLKIRNFEKGFLAWLPPNAPILVLMKCLFWILSFIYLCIIFANSICSGLDESVLEECLQYLEKQLENSQVRKAMEEFFSFR